MGKQWTNWSKSVTSRPSALCKPATIEDIKHAIRAARDRGRGLRMVGSGHSFTPLCATDGTLLSLDRYRGVTAVDPKTRRVRVRAGTPLHQLGEALAAHGLAMENLGDIDVQTLAGALATGTHGTGTHFGSLATQITGLHLILANGEELWCSRDCEPAIFHAARVHLGALGVVTEIELQCVPAYHLAYRSSHMSWSDFLANLDSLREANRNLEFFWFPYTDRVQIKQMNVTTAPESGGRWRRRASDLVVENGAFWGLSALTRVAPRLAPSVCRLEGHSIPSHRLVQAAHRMYATPRLVRFNETEYSIPAEHFSAAVTEIRETIERERFATNFPLELRFVAADDIPLSPAYGRSSAYIAAHMFKGMPYRRYFSALGRIFDRYDGRPHWGKLHEKTASELAPLYPEWQTFQSVRQQLDPGRLFLNAHLRDVFGG